MKLEHCNSLTDTTRHARIESETRLTTTTRTTTSTTATLMLSLKSKIEERLCDHSEIVYDQAKGCKRRVPTLCVKVEEQNVHAVNNKTKTAKATKKARAKVTVTPTLTATVTTTTPELVFAERSTATTRATEIPTTETKVTTSVIAAAAAVAATTIKSDYHPLCYIKMPLIQLIPTLLTAVIFVSELSRCDTQLLDQLITAQKRPPNINQTDNNSLSFHLPRTEQLMSNLIKSTTTSTIKSSVTNQMESQAQQKLSTMKKAEIQITSSSMTAKVEAVLMPNISLTIMPTSTSTSKLLPMAITATAAITTTMAQPTNLEAAAVIQRDQYTLKGLEERNLIALSATTTARTTSKASGVVTTAGTEAIAEAAADAGAGGGLVVPLPPSATFNLTNTTIPLLSYNGNEYSEEWFDSLPTYPLNTINNADSDLPPFDAEQQAAADLLTKGFSIPTFLPPFPVFAVADLPAYLNSVSTTTTTTTTTISPPSSSLFNRNTQNSLQLSSNEQSLADLYDSHGKLMVLNPSIPRRNFFSPATNITVQMGSHAYMPCHIKRLQNKPVSWVRVRDGHIISVDQTTFIADQRFQAIYQDDSEFTWSLLIKYVQPNDEGWYECQVSVEPKMSAKIHLKVVVPLTELIGDQSRFVKAGSKVALHCIVRGTLEPPQYIIWFRDKAQISNDNGHGWYTQLDRNIFGNNNSDNQNTIGSLIIPFVRKADSGNYTCQPSNSAAVSVDLHVLSGEYSASAIMSAGNSCWLTVNHFILFNTIMVVIMLWITQHET